MTRFSTYLVPPVFSGFLLSGLPSTANAQSGDLNCDGSHDVMDVQLMINKALKSRCHRSWIRMETGFMMPVRTLLWPGYSARTGERSLRNRSRPVGVCERGRFRGGCGIGGVLDG